MMQVLLYRHRQVGDDVQAAQYTGLNFPAMSFWTGNLLTWADLGTQTCNLRDTMDGSTSTVTPGDWIVLDNQGRWTAYSAEEFHIVYRGVKA